MSHSKKQDKHEKIGRRKGSKMRTHLLSLASVASLVLLVSHIGGDATSESSIRFDPISNAYSGITFTFDPRLDKRVEWLHFEHWLSIMQQTSSIMHQSLAGRAHLGSVQVLIPYKWRQYEWPLLHKPGVPIISNRRLKYSDSDIIVGFEGKSFSEYFLWEIS